MSIPEIILSLKKLYDGTILEHRGITGYACKKILISSEPVMFAEADGESLGHTPVEIDILPRCLKIIFGRRLSG
jgi:diacylglycerol kinase family enzyme